VNPSTGNLIEEVKKGNHRALARCISLVENDNPEAFDILQGLHPNHKIPVIWITGPPGAGKSTLLNAIISTLTSLNPDSRIAVVAVDPTSPFTSGSLLGDRLRMAQQYSNPNVYIRSVATRGSLGGLSAKTIEIIAVIRSAPFDHIFIETVGVGQSEIEIAGMADATVVVLVPESGDEIQTIKSGIMEIADIFVVNKSDRDGADSLVAGLSLMLQERTDAAARSIPVIKTIAHTNEGVSELLGAITNYIPHSSKYEQLIISKAGRILQDYLLRKVNLSDFRESLKKEYSQPGFNVYRFVANWTDNQRI